MQFVPHHVPPTLAEPVTRECIMQTADRFDLPPRLLLTVLRVEGGSVGKASRNSNGTYDIGPMQINSSWLSQFNGYVTEQQILYNGCINVQVGAWILRKYINDSNGDFWAGVGNYHSHTPFRHQQYQQKIYLTSLNIR
jgi:soluble lytic murein transglycosylase-like protein